MKKMKKEAKKGFWRALFTPKPCACTAAVDQLIAQEQQNEERPKEQPPQPAGEKSGCSCNKNVKQ